MPSRDGARLAAIAAAAVAFRAQQEALARVGRRTKGRRHGLARRGAQAGPAVKKYYVQTDDGLLELEFEEQGEHLLIRVGEQELLVDLRKVSEPSLFSLIVDNQSHEVFVERSRRRVRRARRGRDCTA